VGTFAVQIAKSFWAQVTAVCSPAKAETARALSADTVADYTRKDFTCSGKTLRPDARHSREPHLVTVQRRTRTDCHPGRGPGLGKHCVGRNRTLMHFVGVRLASIRGPAEKWLRSSRSSTRRICWSAEGTRGGTVTQLWTDATISTRCPQPSPTWVKGMPKVRSWCGHEESSQSAYRRHCGKLHAVRIPLPRAYPPVYAAVISAGYLSVAIAPRRKVNHFSIQYLQRVKEHGKRRADRSQVAHRVRAKSAREASRKVL